MVSYNLKLVDIGNGSWTNKRFNVVWSYLVWSVGGCFCYFLHDKKKRIFFYQLFVKDLHVKTSLHEERMHATGEHANTRWYPRVASGSVRRCHSEVCTVSVWVCEAIQRESPPVIGI